MTYDQKCWDLAASFLCDEETVSEEKFKEHVDALAQLIQSTIEVYLENDL